jgi:hypothetical protein
VAGATACGYAVRAPLQLEQVFGHQHANDVFALALVDRKARMRGVDHEAQHLVHRRIDVEQIHAGCGHHDVAGRAVGHAQHALKHDARFGSDEFVVFGLGKNDHQFLDRIGSWVDELNELLQKRALVFSVKRARGVRVGHCLRVQDVR